MPLQAVKDEIFLSTSPHVRRFAEGAIAAAFGRPILDVACGSGRNALFLAQLGATVICIDKELSPFHANLQRRREFVAPLSKRLLPRKIDLVKDRWPFERGSVGGIINIHFFLPALLPHFACSLAPGGHLLLETISGHGDNYLELPQQGELKAALVDAFDVAFYMERTVGPSGHNAVAVKVLARRKEYHHLSS